jgi:hypothetical protein
MTSNIEIRIVDQDGSPFEIDLLTSGNSLVFSIRQTIDSDPLVELSASSTGVLGTYMWQVPSSATVDLYGRLVHDVWGTRDGVQRQVVPASYFNITMRIRR